jgi:hypothetical protein
VRLTIEPRFVEANWESNWGGYIVNQKSLSAQTISRKYMVSTAKYIDKVIKDYRNASVSPVDTHMSKFHPTTYLPSYY